MKWPNKEILLGETDDGARVYIGYASLYEHLQAIGGSNRGKSSFFEILCRAFLTNRDGFTLIDPHGSLFEHVVAFIARYNLHKIRKVHLIEPGAEGWRVGFNPLAVPSGVEGTDLFDDWIDDRIYAVMDGFAQAWGGEDINRMPTYQRYFGALQYALLQTASRFPR